MRSAECLQNKDSGRASADTRTGTVTGGDMRRAVIWNVIGSSLYALVSMILGTLVIRVLGGDRGGIFFFAFSTLGQHIYVISYFGIRALHSTDTGVRYTFGEYHRLRIWTALAALAAALIVALAYSGLSYKAAVIVIVAVYRVLDGYVDVYECEMQRDGHLELTGKSMTFRTLLVMAASAAVMLLTKDLLLTSAALAVALAAAVLIYDVPRLRRIGETAPVSGSADYSVRDGRVKKLFNESIWLFAAVFLDFFAFAASKYAVDAGLTSTMSGYYSTLFVPASAMLLFANFVVRPLLPGMSQAYLGGDRAGLKQTLVRSILIIAAASAAAAAAAYFIGVQVLCIFAGAKAYETMINYRFALALIVVAGGIYGMLTPLYYALVIGRQQRLIFWIYLITAVIAFGLAFLMVDRLGITGGAWSMVISQAVLFLGFYILSAKKLWNTASPVGSR